MKILGVLMIVLALVIGIVPQFSDCASQGRALTLADGRTVPMKCHWTARAEIALAIPLAVTGALMFRSKRKTAVRSLSILGMVLGAVVVALPTALVGVCANPDMICNSFMRPFLIMSGSTVTVLSALALILPYAKMEEQDWVPSV